MFMRYLREAPLDKDRAAMFAMMCSRPSEVARRVGELRAELAAERDAGK